MIAANVPITDAEFGRNSDLDVGDAVVAGFADFIAIAKSCRKDSTS